MKVVVLNVAAESGGALSVLKGFHAAVSPEPGDEWTFLISKPDLHESANVTVLRFPWAKKSILHRLWFDYVKAPKVIQSLNPDVVLSLQNIAAPRARARQVVYLHQSLPFSTFAFRLRDSPRMWAYQKLVSWRILRNLHKADTLVVQADWMKDSVAATGQIPPHRITVVRPAIADSGASAYEPTPINRRHFFYPASALEYKNHAVIIDAVKLLNHSGIHDFEVTFTVRAEALRQKRPDAFPSQIKFDGTMEYDAVQHKYSSSVLVFPSVLETVGLPLIEAQQTGTFILAADLPYAQNALSGYVNVRYFSPSEPTQLASAMAALIEGKIPHIPPAKTIPSADGPWRQVVDLVGEIAHG